jgi:hypothetical protein
MHLRLRPGLRLVKDVSTAEPRRSSKAPEFGSESSRWWGLCASSGRSEQDPRIVSVAMNEGLSWWSSTRVAILARENDSCRQEGLHAARATMTEIFDGAPEFVDLTVVDEVSP